MAEVSKEPSSESTTSAQHEKHRLPPVDFASFISELATAAFAYLGGMQDPETKESWVELEMAKRLIDTIDLLKEKTKGNLTAPEGNFLDNTLYNLKMTYVRMVNNPPPKPKTPEQTDESPPEEPGSGENQSA